MALTTHAGPSSSQELLNNGHLTQEVSTSQRSFASSSSTSSEDLQYLRLSSPRGGNENHTLNCSAVEDSNSSSSSSSECILAQSSPWTLFSPQTYPYVQHTPLALSTQPVLEGTREKQALTQPAQDALLTSRSDASSIYDSDEDRPIRLFSMWAPHAPSNLFWLMQGAGDFFMVCPQCHLAGKNAHTLQTHLNMGRCSNHWMQLPVRLSPTCLKVLPFLAMNTSRGAMTGFSQLGSMRLATSRRMVQIMYDLILTNYSFTRTSVQIAGKLRKISPWKQLPSRLWQRIVSFLF